METNKNTEVNQKMAKALLVPSLIFGIVATFCLYSNFNGITMLLFVASVVTYDVYVVKALEREVKQGLKFYAVGMMLLAIADFTTGFSTTVFYNNCMIFILMVGLQLYLFFDQRNWSNVKYVSSFFTAIFAPVACIGDLFADIDVAVKGAKSEKAKTGLYCLVGILIFIPIGIVLMYLLSSADAVFGKLVEDFFVDMLSIETFVYIPVFFLVMFFGTYCEMRYLAKGELDKYKVETTCWPSAVANTVLVLISFTYITFSMVQIMSLFLGKMALPEGYTYAKYAREGFAQLLFVCFLNVCLVLFIKGWFKEHIFTKILLVVISICTYIMLASSVMRLLLYIKEYNLSLTRVEALWALAMVAVGMLLVIISVFKKDFKLVHAMAILATVGFFALSMSHPDAIVTKYNLEHSEVILDTSYLQSRSIDAAKYIAQEEGAWVDAYQHDRREEAKERSFREFNLSWAINNKYIK